MSDGRGKLETGRKALLYGFLGPKKGFMLSSLVTKPFRPRGLGGWEQQKSPWNLAGVSLMAPVLA